MKKTKLLALLIAVFLLSTMLTFMPLTSFAEESADDSYVPQLVEFKSDTFENYVVEPNNNVPDAVYNNSPLLFVNTSDFYTISGPDVINGSHSFVWATQPFQGDPTGWTGSQLGIGHLRLAGTEGGLLLKITLKVRMVGMNRFVINAREVNAASGDKVMQNMAIDGNYTCLDAVSENLKQDDAETKAESVISADGTYATISLTLRGSDSFMTYFAFDSQIATGAETHYVVLDDITIYKEVKPEVEYIPYRALLSEGFEEGNGIFAFDNPNTNINTEKSELFNENAIKDAQSLRLYSSSRGAESALTSTKFSLAANNYKLYFLTKCKNATMFGVRVINADNDEIIYSYTYSVTSDKRLENAKVTLFDAYACNLDSRGVRTCYGEFALEKDAKVYLQLVYKVSNVNSGYVEFDDVCLLENYQYEEAATTMPKSDAEKIVGTQNATYENLGGSSSAKHVSLEAVVGLGGGFCFCALVVGSVATKKKRKYIALVLALVLVVISLLTACKGPDVTTTEVPSGYRVVAPEKIGGKLDNPGIGWVVLEEPTYGGHIDIGSSGDLPEASLASLSTTWYHIETREDYYDWTMCDQAVDYWTGTGRRVMLRISTDSCVWPYTYNASPAYLFEKYNVGYEWVPYFDNGPVTQARVTNLSDPVYLERLEKFLNALYEHYKDNEMVETVEIRGFGMWGEWHHGYTYDTTEERVETLGAIIDKYYDAFASSGKTLALSCSWDPDYISTNAYNAGFTSEEAYQNFIEWSCFDKAWRTEGITYRRDGGASALRYDYDERLMAEAFRSGKRVPIFGEYANNYYTINSIGSIYTLESALDDVLYKIRPNNTTTLGWVAVEMASIIAAGDFDFIDRGNTMMGYRLAVDEAMFPQSASAGSQISVRTTWSNSAVGIFPYKYPMELKLLDTNGNEVYTYTENKFDARTFVQGEINNVYSQFTIPSGLAEGTYTLAVDIPNVGKSATENDYIALGMAGETSEGSGVYALGQIDVKNNVKTISDGVVRTTWKDIENVKLDANSTYEITFRYQPHFDMKNFFFGNNDCYRFYLSGSIGECGEYRWQDISGEIGQKTVTVHTGNVKDYKICIESINFDAIGVDEVWIEKKGGYYTDFTGYDYLDETTLVAPVVLGTADCESNCIDGDSLVLNSSNTKEKHILAKTDYNNLPLKAGNRYTVTFDFRADSDVGDGGYYFVALGDGDSWDKTLSNKMTVIGEWYERPDNWDTKKSFSFICTEDNQAIFFGVNMAGCYYIDNLTVTSSTVTVVEGIDIGFKHNQIPVYTNIGLGHVETFDKGTFQSSGFNWGQFAFGRMTFDSNEIVGVTEGSKEYMNAEVGTQSNASLLGRVEVEAYDPAIDNQWFEFTRSKLEYYKFKPNAYYTVEFDFRILKQFGSGYVFCFFRDDTLGDRRFLEAITVPCGGTERDSYLTVDGVSGAARNTYQDYHFKQTFQMRDHNYYQFMICMYGMWEIAVDNIYIYEVSAPN